MANNTDEKKNVQGAPEGVTEGQVTAPESGAQNTEGDNAQGGASTSPKKANSKKAAKEPERVPYVLPKNILSDDKYHTVVFNGKVYQIKCGKRVEIPVGVAEVLDNALAQRDAANELAEELQA